MDCLKATETPKSSELKEVQNQGISRVCSPWTSPSFWCPTTLSVLDMWIHHSIITWLSPCLMCPLRIYLWIENHLNLE